MKGNEKGGGFLCVVLLVGLKIGIGGMREGIMGAGMLMVVRGVLAVRGC